MQKRIKDKFQTALSLLNGHKDKPEISDDVKKEREQIKLSPECQKIINRATEEIKNLI